MPDARTVLQNYWGYPAFRPPQEAIIEASLSGSDVLALLPTGAGKSICYQVPALVRDGVCLVISPLIALMKDQVQQLKKRDIRASAIFSGLRPAEIDMILNNCATGHTRILYVSPERLASDRFRIALKGLPVSMLAVDEAHCISQWGHDFRPSYREIVQIREWFPDIPVIALTASATPEVQEDIIGSLGFRKEYKVFSASFERPNIAFAVRQDIGKPEKVLEIVSKVPGTAIIYASNRKRTEEIARFLDTHGISATYYHAGLNAGERNSRQDAWISNRQRVMCCTNAFGMGIDKPDVRLVIHADVPESLEAYYQEAGRAGRDGKKSYAVLLCNEQDKDQLIEQVAQKYPELSFVKLVYNALYNYLSVAFGGGKGHSFEFNIVQFARQYKWDTVQVFHALKLLEQSGYLTLGEAFYLPSRIQITMDKMELYRFQVANMKYDPFIKTILRTYEGIFNNFVKINELQLAHRAGLSAQETITQLKILAKSGVLTYIQSSEKPRITFLEERLHEDYIRLDTAFIEFSKAQQTRRIEAMLDYADAGSESCRQVILRRYFGEENPSPCGSCDLCLSRKQLQTVTPEQIRTRLLHIVSGYGDEGVHIETLLSRLGNTLKEQYIEMLRILIDEQQLIWADQQNQTLKVR